MLLLRTKRFWQHCLPFTEPPPPLELGGEARLLRDRLDALNVDGTFQDEAA